MGIEAGGHRLGGDGREKGADVVGLALEGSEFGCGLGAGGDMGLDGGAGLGVELAIDIGHQLVAGDLAHLTVLKCGSPLAPVAWRRAARARPSRLISVPRGMSRIAAASA